MVGADIAKDTHKGERQDQHGGPEIWEHQATYLGHGEWDTMDEPLNMAKSKKLEEMDNQDRIQLETEDTDIMRAKAVKEKGYPNMYGAKIPVKSGWNLQALEHHLKDYHDKEVIEGIRYGWPTGRLPTLQDPARTFKNHQGATEHPEALKKYIRKEKAKGAILGPYTKIPFTEKVGISPISTRPKKNSSERRIIIDLSFPHGEAVNDGMVKSYYMGFKAELRFPRTDDLAFRIATLGKDACMFKIDLSRYFRQIPLDPADYSMIGYIIDGELYFDKMLPMGMRTAPFIAQRITNAIKYIHEKLRYFLLNYVDDFLGAETKARAQAAFDHLTQLLKQLGVETAPDKIVPPTTRIEFLGVTFDSQTMTIEVSPDKIQDMLAELSTWTIKTTASRKEVESIIGKLQFASKCIKPGRTFISRLINWLRGMNRQGQHRIPLEARKDLAWWGKFLERYNGVSMLWLHKQPQPDAVIASDACPKGYGATCGSQYFHRSFPQEMRNSNIAHLEMLAVLAAIRTWTTELQGKYFWIHVDNEAVATVLNTGASRDVVLQAALRDILMIAATNNFMIKAKHIRGVDNRIPDWLSRWEEPEARKKFREYAKEKSLRRININPDIININENW